MTDLQPRMSGDGAPSSGYRISVRGSNVDFGVQSGETVFEAAQRSGYYWPTVCGGRADCTRCMMIVLEGAEHLSPMTEFEREALVRQGGGDGAVRPNERLACCTKLTGPVVVHRRSVRLRGKAEMS